MRNSSISRRLQRNAKLSYAPSKPRIRSALVCGTPPILVEITKSIRGFGGDSPLSIARNLRAIRYRAKTNRSEEHTSELQSLMRISYAVFCLKKKNKKKNSTQTYQTPHTDH